MKLNAQVKKNGSTIPLRLMCATIFFLFSFAWLYCFQTDLLVMVQHVKSNGITSYNPLVGAIIITLLLFMLQQVVYFITKLKKRFHALTYFPSFYLLAILTDVNLLPDGGVEFNMGWGMFFLLVPLWILLVWFALQYQKIEGTIYTVYFFFSRPFFSNALLMLPQVIFVTWMGNTDAVLHYRLAIENHLRKGNSQAALEVGKNSLEGDANLLMLRMFALARENALGERLFNYPITGSVSQLLPTNGETRLLLCSDDSIFKLIGARPASPMEPMRYLELVAGRDSVVSRQVADYCLCGLLIDRKLDRFAKEVGKFYTIDEHLPRHYREALTLYTHLRANPVLVYQEAVTEENWANLQELEHQYPLWSERKGKVFEMFGNTYWYYYEYVE